MMWESSLRLLGWNVTLAALLAIGVALISLLPAIRQRPALRHSLWLLVLIKLVTPPIIPVPMLSAGREASWNVAEPELEAETALDAIIPTDPAVADATVIEGVPGPDPLECVDSDSVKEQTALPLPLLRDKSSTRAGWWQGFFLLVGLWSVTSILLVAQLALKIRRLARVIRIAEPGSERIQGIAAKAALRMKVRKVIVRQVSNRAPPLVWGGLREPTIIFPLELTQKMNDEQLTHIACHELAHYVRRDHWSNTFAAVVSALFWWHPAVWFAQREMRRAQDLCADESAIVACRVARRSYLETLLQALDLLQADSELPVAPATRLFEQRSLASRFRILSRGNLVHRNQWMTRATLLVMFALFACIPVSAKIKSPSVTMGSALDEPSLGVAASPPSQGDSEVETNVQVPASARPLFLHWLGLKSAGDQWVSEVILTTRVEPNRDFDVIFTGTEKPPREHWIRGRITSQSGARIRANIQCYWQSPEEYTGSVKLDQAVDASGFMWVDGYSPTRLILSYSSSPKKLLRPQAIWRGAFAAESSSLRVAAIRPANYANEFGESVGNSVANWLSSRVYDPSNPKEEVRNRRLAVEAVARMLAKDKQRIDWRLDRVEPDKAIQIAVHKARFTLDLGDGTKWDQDVMLKYSLQRRPKLRRYEIRATVSPAASDVHLQFSLPHPRGKPDGRFDGMARVRSAYYSTGQLKGDGSWAQVFDQIKSKPLDFSIESTGDGG